MCDYVATPDFRLVVVLWGLATTHSKLYAYPAQQTLLDLVRRFHGRQLSRRSANRHLGALQRDGWIQRIRRHRYRPGIGLEMHSTLYKFTRRAVRYFAGVAGRTARVLGKPWQTRQEGACAISGTISVHTVQSNVPGVAAPPPGNNKKVAREQIARIQEVLKRG